MPPAKPEKPAAPTRGGLKLEAALARFPLAARVKGARALDIGASTGGFTDVMLRAGAAHVTAIDVGHGQLLPRLRADARVVSLEKTDFKTLALREAAGPYDFFTVDVSFVAARSMLRSLAFRLRDGAEGVVLVKPQFELPSNLVKAGDVSDPALRARALASFRSKAEGLGFALVEVIDSPVAGGEGTVEMLAHLRFAGRSERMPAPGAKVAAPRAPRAARSSALTGSLRWFAVAAPGLEEVVAEEVRALPEVARVKSVAGGVEFAGPFAAGMAANLRLRTATRVLVRVGEARAREFGKLRRLASKLDWQPLVDPTRPVRFEITQRASRLYHTVAIAETLALAIEDRVGKKLVLAEPGVAAEDGGVQRVFARGEGDLFTFSVDASGELLHRRGWRHEAGEAPLRETLAAGLLALAGFDPARPFVDLMCGAGTIVIEAAAWAAGRAPGAGREFGFARWPGFDAAASATTWARVRGEVGGAREAPVALGFDRDADMVAIAARTAERAGLGDRARFAPAALGDAAARPAPGAPTGLVVVNPPYGRRLGTRAEAARAIRALGRTLARDFAGWTAGVLLGEAGHAKLLGLPVKKTVALWNGGVRVSFVVVDVPRG